MPTMGIYQIKPAFQAILRPMVSTLVRWGVSPDALSYAALVVSALMGAAFFFVLAYPWLLLLIPVGAFVRTALNALDGMVARAAQNTPPPVSTQRHPTHNDAGHRPVGEVMNELIDRLCDAIIFLSLAFAPYTDVHLGAVVTVLILINSYLSILSKAAGGSRQYGGIMGKADRMIVLGVGAALGFVLDDIRFGDAVFWVVGVGMVLTFFLRLRATWKELS